MSGNISQPLPARTEPPELSWQRLDRLDWHLWLLAVLLISVLGGGLLSFMFPSAFWMKEGVAVETQQRAFFGFATLLFLILVYLLQKQAKLRRLKRELVEVHEALARAEKEAAIQSFLTLPSTGQFHDALAMEYRRASTSGDHLALVLFVAPGASSEMLGRMARQVRSMLRRGETLYRISDKAVGVILPGMQLSNVASFAAQVEELSCLPKEDLEVRIAAYPQDASSLTELEGKLRGLLSHEVTEA